MTLSLARWLTSEGQALAKQLTDCFQAFRILQLIHIAYLISVNHSPNCAFGRLSIPRSGKVRYEDHVFRNMAWCASLADRLTKPFAERMGVL